MQPSEYERQVAQTTLPVYVLAQQLLEELGPGPLTERAWLTFLQALYLTVREASWTASGIARAFYDAERERQIPGAPLHLIDRVHTSFNRFVRDMEPVREVANREGFSVETIALRATRTVENAARRTVIRAVDSPDPALDPIIDSQEESEPGPPRSTRPQSNVRKLIKGWARVPTGRETCGFCWMLASRGPVYKSASGAGAKITQQDALFKTADGSFSSEDMNQWHAGCDCKVVPVYRLDSWSGKEKADAAWQLWESEIKDRYSGKDALNEYRKLVESGELDKLLAARRRAA